MARIAGRRADDTRDAALAAATRAFAERGFDGASLASIARSAGITAPAIAYHFGDKAGLRDAVLAAIYADLVSLAGQLPEATELRPTLDALYGFLEARRDSVRVLLRSILEHGGLEHTRDRYVGPTMQLAVPVVAKAFGATEADARRAIVALTHLAVRFLTNTPTDNALMLGTDSPEATRAAVVDLLVDVATALLRTDPRSTP